MNFQIFVTASKWVFTHLKMSAFNFETDAFHNKT